jgi:hypothetical protein
MASLAEAAAPHDPRPDAFRCFKLAAEIAALTELPVLDKNGNAVMEKVPANAKLLAFALAMHTNSKTGRCDPSQETLAADIGVASVRRVQEAVNALKRIRALKVKYGRGKRASYELIQTRGFPRVSEPRHAEIRGSDTRKSAGLDTRKSAGPTTNYEVRTSPVRKSRTDEGTVPAPTAATDNQLDYLNDLAAECGEPVPVVNTRFEANRQIRRLKKLKEATDERRVAPASHPAPNRECKRCHASFPPSSYEIDYRGICYQCDDDYLVGSDPVEKEEKVAA